MRTLFRSLLLLALTLSLNLLAGEKGNKKGEGGGKMGDPRAKEIEMVLDHSKELSLTDVQKKQLDALKDKIDQSREKAMKDPETRELFKEVQAARKDGDEEKLKKLREKMRERMSKDGGPDFITEFTKILTPEQMAKLKELREKEGGGKGKFAGGGGGEKGGASEGKKPDSTKGVPSLFDNEK